jgi:outer membrane protein assembly factor BamB
LCLVACSHRHEKPPPKEVAPLDTEVLRLAEEFAFIGVDDSVFVVEPTGHVLSKPAITPGAARHGAGRHHVFAWLDGANGDELHMTDLETGRERWRVTIGHRANAYTVGERSVGIGTARGVELRHLADGSRGYQRSGAKAIAVDYDAGLFVFAEEYGVVDAVDEATDASRWQLDLAWSHADDASIRRKDSIVIVDGTEIDIGNGKVQPSRSSDPKPKKYEYDQELARSRDGSRLVHKGDNTVSLVSDGKVIWRTAWSPRLEFRAFDGDFAIHDDVGLALLTEYQHSSLLIAFDAKSGRPLFQHDSPANSRFVSFVGDCAVVLGDKMDCIDPKNGETRWSRPYPRFGTDAWRDGDDLVIMSDDSNVVERVDATGATRWKTSIDTAPSSWTKARKFLVYADAGKASFIDLATGALASVVLAKN